MRHEAGRSLSRLAVNPVKLVLLLLLLTGITVLSSGCRLYTVVKIEKASASQEQGIKVYFENNNFDAEKYVDSIWQSKVLPYMEKKAADALAVLAGIRTDKEIAGSKYGFRSTSEGSPWNFIIKGKGRITAVNTESRNGTIDLDLPPYDHNKDLKIQIGPVFKGTSIRDSLDFISFDEFENQIEFARLANTFNKKVYDETLCQIDFKDLVDREVEFLGAFTDGGAEVLVTPVKLTVVEGGQ